MEEAAPQAKSLLVFVVLSFCVYWLSEWMFLMSGLSFLRDLGFAASVSVLASSVVVVVVPLGVVAIGSTLLFIVPSKLRWLVVVGLLCVPVAMQTFTVILLVDNFTYTMFSFGVKHASGTGLWLYRVCVAVGFAFLLVRNGRWLSELQTSPRRPIWSAVAGGVVGVSLVVLALKVFLSAEPEHFSLVSADRRPNIIFIASDGLPASRLGAYGASRDTTPFLDEFKSKTLFFSNAFSNAASTFPSTSSC